MPFKIYGSYDSTSNEMGRIISQDHDPIRVTAWGGRVRCKRFGAYFRDVDGGTVYTTRKFALFELPPMSLVVGGYVWFNTGVAGLDGSVIRIFPEGNDVEDNLRILVTDSTADASQTDNALPLREIALGQRDYFPSGLPYWEETYAQGTEERWLFCPDNYGTNIQGTTNHYGPITSIFKSSTVWFATVAKSYTFGANESYILDGLVHYVCEG